MTVLFVLVLLPLFVFTVGRLCSRLLGVRLGLWHSIAVGIIGWVAGVAAAAAAIGKNTPSGRSLDLSGFDNWAAAFATAIFFGVLATMPVAIVLDLLARRRPGAGTPLVLAQPDPARQGCARAVRPHAPGRRYRPPARPVAPALRLALGARVARSRPPAAAVLEDSGGMLVKFGQVASTRGDILPRRC